MVLFQWEYKKFFLVYNAGIYYSKSLRAPENKLGLFSWAFSLKLCLFTFTFNKKIEKKIIIIYIIIPNIK